MPAVTSPFVGFNPGFNIEVSLYYDCLLFKQPLDALWLSEVASAIANRQACVGYLARCERGPAESYRYFENELDTAPDVRGSGPVSMFE